MHFFISVKSSRIAYGDPVSARVCFGAFYPLLYLVLIILLVFGFIKKDNKKLAFINGLFAALSLALLTWSVSLRYNFLPYDTSRARMTFGIGFLISIFALYSIVIKCCQDLSIIKIVIINLAAWGVIGVLLATGQLNHYSVMQEYMAARSQFFSNVSGHVKLSLIVLVAATLLGVPIGYLCNKHPILDDITILGISIIETIPMLALFAVMRIPLAALSDAFPKLKAMGIGSFGAAPAFTALLLYALYLMIHNSRAAFNTIEDNYIENAYALGMTSKDVFFKVQIPLALPILLAAIRITLVATLVSASLASYVGGAGLGTYIVNGINSLSIDMQLLGVIPIFILTVCADRLLRFVFDLIIPGKKKGKK